MSSVFQNQLLKVEKGLLVGCLEKRGRLAGGSRSGQRGRRRRGEWQVRLGERREEKESDEKGDRWEEVKEGGDTGKSFISCTGFASHGMICNWRYQSHPTFCLACTTALQKSCACRWWHSSHIWLWTTYSTTNTCCRMVEFNTWWARGGGGGEKNLSKDSCLTTQVYLIFYPELHQWCLTEEGTWTVKSYQSCTEQHILSSAGPEFISRIHPPLSFPIIRQTSFCTVSLTLTLLEWGSVHTKPASTRWTLFRPFSFFRQIASSSRDSRAHDTHAEGGWRYLRNQLFVLEQ